MLNAYKYDQLNRLLEARSYETGLSSNVWNPTVYNNEYRNTFTYDANGNILTQQRYPESQRLRFAASFAAAQLNFQIYSIFLFDTICG